MTQRVSRRGTVYTVGSGDAYGGWEPRTCAYGAACLFGGRIVKSHTHGLAFERTRGVGLAWHSECRRRLGPVPGR